MDLIELVHEPMIRPNRLAERHKCDRATVVARIRKLEANREINPEQRPGGYMLSFHDAQLVDRELGR